MALRGTSGPGSGPADPPAAHTAPRASLAPEASGPPRVPRPNTGPRSWSLGAPGVAGGRARGPGGGVQGQALLGRPPVLREGSAPSLTHPPWCRPGVSGSRGARTSAATGPRLPSDTGPGTSVRRSWTRPWPVPGKGVGAPVRTWASWSFLPAAVGPDRGGAPAGNFPVCERVGPGASKSPAGPGRGGQRRQAGRVGDPCPVPAPAPARVHASGLWASRSRLPALKPGGGSFAGRARPGRPRGLDKTRRSQDTGRLRPGSLRLDSTPPPPVQISPSPCRAGAGSRGWGL